MNKKSETVPTRKFGKKSEADAPFKVGDFVTYDAVSDGKDDFLNQYVYAEIAEINDDGTFVLWIYDLDDGGNDVNDANPQFCTKLDHFAGHVDSDHYYMDGKYNAYKGGWEILITEKELDPKVYEFIGTIDELGDVMELDDYYGGENFAYDIDLKDTLESSTPFDVNGLTFADMSGDTVKRVDSSDESKKSEASNRIGYIQYKDGKASFNAESAIVDYLVDNFDLDIQTDRPNKKQPEYIILYGDSTKNAKKVIDWAKSNTEGVVDGGILSSRKGKSKKSEATAFGAGMSKRKDFTKARNLGDVLEALEKHRDFLQAKSEDLTQSKEDLKASIDKLKEFSAHVDFLKQQSVKGIKDAISFNKSPEVKAAADVEQQLKDALKILYSDYSNIPDVTQLLTVLDSRYATTGDKVVTSWIDNADRAISVDAQTIKDSIADGLLSEDDVVKLITVTSVQHGVKNKDTVEKVGPVLARMNALLETAPKLEEAVIDPKQFKELRDLVEQIVEEASAPKDIIKTTISSITKDELGKIKPLESKMVEGLLDKLKQMVSALGEKISALWDSFTSAFFGLEDEALESAEVFNEVEETLGYTGIQMESRIVKEETLGKKMEVLTKSVLTCCDNLVKDASLAGDFDDEVIYAEEAVKNAIESFQNLGEACKSLKSALSYHKNENNMDVIGILADAITQIVADDSGETEGGEEGSEEEDDSVVGQVEREYAPNGGPEHRELPTSEPVAAPNPAGAEEPEEF